MLGSFSSPYVWIKAMKNATSSFSLSGAIGFGSRRKDKSNGKPTDQPPRTEEGPVADELTGTSAFDAGTGKMPSWADLVAEHADGVYRLAYRLSGNKQDAEDLTQETFMRVFRSLKSYKPGAFKGWLHRITTNLFLDMVRHRSAIRMEALNETAYDRYPGSDPTPDEAYINSNLDPTLERALFNLSPDYRVAVVLCDMEGLSYEEIAETLGVKMGTVRSRIHRGRKQLREYILAAAEESDAAKALVPQH